MAKTKKGHKNAGQLIDMLSEVHKRWHLQWGAKKPKGIGLVEFARHSEPGGKWVADVRGDATNNPSGRCYHYWSDAHAARLVADYDAHLRQVDIERRERKLAEALAGNGNGNGHAVQQELPTESLKDLFATLHRHDLKWRQLFERLEAKVDAMVTRVDAAADLVVELHKDLTK